MPVLSSWSRHHGSVALNGTWIPASMRLSSIPLRRVFPHIDRIDHSRTARTKSVEEISGSRIHCNGLQALKC
jgi:hypothetical protein